MTAVDLRASVETLSQSPAASFLAVFRPAIDERQPCLDLLGDGGSMATLTSDERCTVLFSGHLVDRRRVTQVAGADPAVSDADLVLALYKRLGAKGFGELRGFFAVALHDQREDVLYFLRDQLGHNSFYFAEGSDGFYFSDSAARLVRHERISAAVNRPVVAEIMIHRTRGVDETVFEAVHRVRAGWLYRKSSAGIEAARYWFPVPPDGSPWATAEELVEFEPLMRQAVERTLEAGATGIFLSGGLDSVTVAMHATDLLSERGEALPVALSLVFPEYEETEVQRDVAENLGLEHELVPYEESTGPDSLVATAVRASGTWPMPLVNLWQPLYTDLALRARSKGLTRVLTGAGGDEWLQVSPAWGFSRLRRFRVRPMRHLYKTYLQSYNLERGPLLRNLVWKYGLQYSARRTAKSAFHRLAPTAGARLKVRTFREHRPAWLAPDAVLTEALERRAGALQRIDYAGVRFDKHAVPYLENTVTAMENEESFERGLRLGVHTYSPFWDPDLDRFLARVPPELMNQGYWAKGLVRGPLARRFPNAGFESQKKVLSTTLSTRLAVEQIPGAWAQLGGVSALAGAGIVDERVLQSEFERRLSVLKRPEGASNGGIVERAVAAHAIWTVLNVESWLRQWI